MINILRKGNVEIVVNVSSIKVSELFVLLVRERGDKVEMCRRN